MNNLYEDISGNVRFNRLEIGGLLFSEYTCPLEDEFVSIWTEQDYLVHVVSGKKTWHTSDGSWVLRDGDTLFFKKGAGVVEQHFESDFCVMIFFIPDEVTREVVTSHLAELGPGSGSAESRKCAIPVESDAGLEAFFGSMRTYFDGDEKPTAPLLRLKLHELILSILTSRVNQGLASYLRSVAATDGPLLEALMEANYRYNLSLEEFARMCHRSLSTFKRDFRKHFGEPPGRWLLQRRLDFAAALLRGAEGKTITEIAFDAGFADLSHFNKSFKTRFGVSPTSYRESEGDQ